VSIAYDEFQDYLSYAAMCWRKGRPPLGLQQWLCLDQTAAGLACGRCGGDLEIRREPTGEDVEAIKADLVCLQCGSRKFV